MYINMCLDMCLDMRLDVQDPAHVPVCMLCAYVAHAVVQPSTERVPVFRWMPTANADTGGTILRVAVGNGLNDMWSVGVPSDRHHASAFAVGMLRDILRKMHRRSGPFSVR